MTISNSLGMESEGSWDTALFSKKSFLETRGISLSLPERMQHSVPNKCIERNMCSIFSQMELKKRLTTTHRWVLKLNSLPKRLQVEDLIHVLKKLYELEML